MPQQRVDVNAAVLRHVARQPPAGFLQLPAAADGVAATRLVPGHRDVHEPLAEVALRGLGRAPFVLEYLVRGEELAAANQLETRREAVRSRR